jgi:hypothetical protein
MKNHFSSELIAPCGMNCNICSGYLAIHHELRNKGIRISYCKGCRPRDKQCAFLKKRCSRLSNHTVQFCYECKEYPCQELKHLDTRYQTFFRMSPLENLAEIKTKGMENFLRTQEKRWRCPTCGGTRCCHNGLCFHCDREILKTKKKIYRWEDDG